MSMQVEAVAEVVATHVEEQVSTTVEAPVVDKALVARLVAGARGQGCRSANRPVGNGAVTSLNGASGSSARRRMCRVLAIRSWCAMAPIRRR